MFRTPRLKWRSAVVSLVVILLTAWVITAPKAAEAQTFTGVQGDRHRIYLGFQVKPEAVQALLPAPWQLNPPTSGPLKGANFNIILIERVRDDDPDGKPKYTGTNRIIAYTAPAKHPGTGAMAAMILGGFASNPAYQPGFYKNFRAASVRVEHAIKSQELDAEEIADVWEVRDATGAGGLELRLESLRKVGARIRSKGEPNVISAKDPGLWRIYKFDAAMDVVKSEGVDRVKKYAFRFTDSEFGKLFDGSERLVGIFVQPWYVRQVFAK
jgi:hypothetical protein